tara:strand:- start:4705 stop:5127 length:423 start_codon:yes stop_codon:yes gene_type:complete
MPYTIKVDELDNALEDYQKTLIQNLIDNGASYEEAANTYLSVNADSTSPFGTINSDKDFFSEVKKQFHKLLCGHSDYEEERKEILGGVSEIGSGVTTAIATWIGATFGVAMAIVLPVVVLLLKLAAKIGLNAWCETTSIE